MNRSTKKSPSREMIHSLIEITISVYSVQDVSESVMMYEVLQQSHLRKEDMKQGSTLHLEEHISTADVGSAEHALMFAQLGPCSHD